ncbi:MAG: hypothetical protein A2583_07815 [Bdellovibrionales bacterium RIFOXYD1_FULL_53_11]|nr:MAG: hypothetical protein A2583_07815 [Bdellovibrionales bacterium RIFOXYD1_FULL_53_11]
MSATRDKAQKFTFVYSNLYKLYKNGNEAPSTPPIDEVKAQAAAFASGRVIKAGDARVTPMKVTNYKPAEFISRRIGIVPKPEILRNPQSEALDSLKQNLKSLNDLHSRLRVMLKELEDLTKE